MIPQLNVQTLTYEQLAKTIDHSLLKPHLTDDDVRQGCELAARYHTASVCVKPYHVPLAADVLKDTDVSVGTVVGFPHGAHTTETKAFEARLAVEQGAEELDMVINIGALRAGHDDYVRNDIRAVVEAAGDEAIVKVILENHHLTDEEIARGCRLAEQAGAHYVKSSTGYAETGSKVEDLMLMRDSVNPSVGVKAAHGVRDLDSALAAIGAGATRIGATQTVGILDEFEDRFGKRRS